MRPDIRRDRLLLGQPDHVHRRPIARRPAGSAAERAFQFPDRRLAGAEDGVERKAGAGFAALAHHLEPAIAAIEALRDGRRGLRGAAKAFHLFRPQQAFRSVGFARGLGGLCAACCACTFAPRTRSPNSRRLDFPPIGAFQRPLRAATIPLDLRLGRKGAR